MLISPREIKKFYGISPKRILHIGAHLAEEVDSYLDEGWGLSSIFWVESNPSVFPELELRLKSYPENTAILALIWSVKNLKMSFNISNNSESSSVLLLKEHEFRYPNIIFKEQIELTSSTISDLWEEYFFGEIDFINLDIQGAELHALKGAGGRLSSVKYIYSEINVLEMYKDCALFKDLKDWLSIQDFTLIDWDLTRDGWGDALWVNNNYAIKYFRLRRFKRKIYKYVNFLYSRFNFNNNI